MKYSKHVVAWITTIIIPIDSSTTLTSQVFCNAGSVYENKETNGLSHFLEHMFFKGWKRYPTMESIAKTLDAIGAEHNAYTSDYIASYYVKSSPEHRKIWLDVLSDMICNATFPEEEIKKETGVILQELQMYKDQPRHEMLKHAKQWYHGDNAYGWPIIGTEETIQSVTSESLHTHKNALYTKDNMIIVIAGKIDNEEDILNMISEHFKDLGETTTLQKAPYNNYKPSESSSKLVQWINQSHLVMFADGIPMQSEKQATAAKLLANILGGTTSSKLWMEIREKLGLCYYVGARHSSNLDFGQFSVSAGLDKKQLQIWIDAIELILKQASEGELTREDFELAKNNYLGSLQMGLETSDAIADRVGYRYMMKKEIKTLEEIMEQYKVVTYEEVMNLCKMLEKSNWYTYWIE